MKWVIEKNCFEENEEELKKLTNSCFVKYRPFDESKQFETLNGLLPQKDDNHVIFYGSINLGRKLIKQGYAWQVWLPDNVFDVNYWGSHLNKFCFNSMFRIYPFACIEQNICDEDRPFFIRPNSGFKLFTGHVIDPNSVNPLKELKDLQDQYSIFPEDLISISDFQQIESEYRFVIGSSLEESYVLSGSQYKVDGEHYESNEIPDKCLEFTTKVLEYCDKINYNPAPAWTLDVCENWNNEYFVLETGSFSSAGLYSCNMEDVVKGVNSITKEYLNE